MTISIITVCYNSASTIRDTFDSVLHQTYSDIEYIVVDGKSTDDTVAIIKEYEPKFGGRMRWISEPDKGIYDAMNKGIKIATGDLIGIVNSDDFYNDNSVLKTIESIFRDNKIDSLFADVQFIKGDNPNKIVRYYSSAHFNPNKFKYGFMPAHPTFFTYKENYIKYGLYKTDYKIAADYELLVRFLYVHKLTYTYIPLVIIKMRIGGRSTKNLISNYIINQEFIRGCTENGIKTNMFILFFRYFRKIFVFIFTRN
jgi:glycosyltransferase involved in cell wall biosynthesis